MGSHGAKWDGGDLEAALMNVKLKPGGGNNVRNLFQWIAWIIEDEDSTAGKNLEAALESAEDFHALNSAIADASEVANNWWPDSPGGQHEKSGHDKPGTLIARGDEEEESSDEEMMRRWGKPEEEE